MSGMCLNTLKTDIEKKGQHMKYLSIKSALTLSQKAEKQ